MYEFLHRPILDDNGKDWSKEIGGIPPCCGALFQSIFNYILLDVDNQLEQKFPNLKFARYLSHMFLPINEDSSFSIEKLNELLEKWGELKGFVKFLVIERGSPPIPCYGGSVQLSKEGISSFIRKDYKLTGFSKCTSKGRNILFVFS